MSYPKDKLHRYEAKQERIDLIMSYFDEYTLAGESQQDDSRSSNKQSVQITGILVHRTPKALLIDIDKECNKQDIREGECWIPLSCIPKLTVDKDKHVIATVEVWILRSNGMLITG